jgi:phospholipid-binding lipoprotein MlaA
MKKQSAFCYKNFALVFMAGLSLASCSTAKNEIVEDNIVISDPFEESNRRIFAFNNAVDSAIINPVVKGYRAITPTPVRSGIRNFLRNLRSPVLLGNQMLQGDIGGAADVLARAVVNTTVGIGGIFDVAGKAGIEYEAEDFGQTLAVWGVGNGPYIVVPILGPSSLRDYSGYFADTVADPLRWYLYNIDEEELYYAKLGLDYLDLRESLMDALNELEEGSIDCYAAVRSTYYQRRQAMIDDRSSTAAGEAADIPDYDSSSE